MNNMGLYLYQKMLREKEEENKGIQEAQKEMEVGGQGGDNGLKLNSFLPTKGINDDKIVHMAPTATRAIGKKP
jgi:hypothetical protein